MKNITISIANEVHRRALITAAGRKTSISELVEQFLLALVRNESDFDRLAQDERELRQRIESFRAADRLSRDQLHDRLTAWLRPAMPGITHPFK
jgi:hypothetical protein